MVSVYITGKIRLSDNIKQRDCFLQCNLWFIGEKINLLDVDSVASFSTNSRAIYSPSEGDQYAYLTINLSLLDSPNGVYTLTVTPDIVSGTFDKYNLEVETEYDRRPAKDSFDTSNGKQNPH